MKAPSMDRRTPARRLWIAWLFGPLVALGLVACGEGPLERYEQAVAAKQQKDLDAFLGFFTQASKEILRGIDVAGSRSRIYYTRNVFDVLPEGDVEGVSAKDGFALIRLRQRGTTHEVRMFKEHDKWVIDVFSLEGLWRPLKE